MHTIEQIEIVTKTPGIKITLELTHEEIDVFDRILSFGLAEYASLDYGALDYDEIPKDDPFNRFLDLSAEL